MLYSATQKLRKGLTPECMKDVPPQAIEAYSELIGLLYMITTKCLPYASNFQDYEDAESDALLRGISYIRNVSTRHKETAYSWSKVEWKRRLYSRFYDGVIESAKYLLYPFNLPRAIRFSLKKYSDAVGILQKYSRLSNIRSSVLYKSILLKRCSIDTIAKCKKCIFKLAECPLTVISTDDLQTLHSLVTNSDQSLSHYADYYHNTPYKIWIRIMESLKDFSSFQVDKQELPASYDMERGLTLKRVQQKMKKIHPKLFDIYCQLMTSVDTDALNTQLYFPPIKSWQSRIIREDYGIKPIELRRLLKQGDRLINAFRQHEGLLPIQRTVYSKSTTP